MKSVPLTEAMREKIIEAMIVHRFTADVEALFSDRATLADQIYKDLYKAGDRARMEELPNGWLPEAESLRVKFGDERDGYDDIQFTGRMFYHGWSIFSRNHEAPRAKRRVADRHKDGCAKAYDPSHKRVAQWRAIKDQEEALRAQIEEVRREIKGALSSIGTTARLLQAWPEAAPFLAAFEKRVAVVPAIPVADLNAKLGLPVEGEAA